MLRHMVMLKVKGIVAPVCMGMSMTIADDCTT